MDAKLRNLLRTALWEQRQRLLRTVADTEADLRAIDAERETEFVERSQEERDARLLALLDDRARHEIEEVDAALRRLHEPFFGVCEQCGRPIGTDRLMALPAARFCLECEKRHERAMAARQRR